MTDLRVFNNGIVNHGRTWIYENASAVLDESCLLFGDSFAINMVKFLALWFRKLVYIHTTSIDAAIIRRERPDFLLCEVAERFLIRAPVSARRFDIRNVIAQKIARSELDLASSLVERQRAYWPDFQADLAPPAPTN